jgi:hypothetical protein
MIVIKKSKAFVSIYYLPEDTEMKWGELSIY